MAKRKEKRAAKATNESGAAPDTAAIQTEIVRGGLAVYERGTASGQDGELFHLVPADVARALRILVSRIQQGEEVTIRETITVTSALSGEGVTSTSRSLAAILAHDLDRSVCLLEANWWLPEDDLAPGSDPSADDAAAMPARPGLADVLRGTSTIDDVVMRTNDDRLVVIAAGRMPIGDRPSAVASSAFAEVLELLAKDHDTVVIDAPPVLKSTEAVSIARHTEATALVVHQGVTTEEQLTTAIEELDGTELLGVIVNRSSSRIPRRLQRLGLSA